ncbi:methionyl-tRNA formyltransferase [Polaromonas aquatica]|uniref:methionyl-tRNA formyltransferase n=1 Tax=Polaromonas aquatica TaxID=332657 RepID=UPI003D64767E
MRIAFLSGGAREHALRFLLEKGENVCGVITPALTPQNRRFERVVTTAIEFFVPVIPTKRNGLGAILDQLKPDVIVSCGYPYVIDRRHIASVRHAINVHPTLLPKYRGYRSGPFVLINGEKRTGVTVHFLTNELDRGNIIIQREVELSSFDTPKSMYRKCQEIEPQALYDAIQLLKTGNVVGHPQDEMLASEYLKLRTPEDSEIDATKSLLSLFNSIRACDPVSYPAFFFVEGQKVCITLWRPERPDGDGDDTL